MNDHELNKILIEYLTSRGYVKYVNDNIMHLKSDSNHIRFVYKNAYLSEMVNIIYDGENYNSIFKFIYEFEDDQKFNIDMLVKDLIDNALDGNDFERLKRALSYLDISHIIRFFYKNPYENEDIYLPHALAINMDDFHDLINAQIPFGIVTGTFKAIYINWYEHNGKMYHKISNDNDPVFTERDIESIKQYILMKSI